MPLAWDLTKEIEKWLTPDRLRELNAGWRTQHGGGYPEEVIEDLAKLLTNPDMHYEAKLGYLQTQSQRYSNRQNLQAYHGLYEWLVELVYMLLYQRHVLNVAFIQRGLRFYRGLADLAEAHKPLWVFTLNHDLLVECIAAEYGVPLSAGLSERSSLPCPHNDGSPGGDLSIETRTIAEIEREAFNFFVTPGTHGINLFKIHGALDLFVADDGKELVRLLPQEFSTAGIVAALKVANENLFYEELGQRLKVINEISYTDRDGEAQFLRRSLLAGAYKFDKRSRQVLPDVMLGQFGSTLNYVNELVCIGYGFGDNHINDVLRRWLEFTDDRRIVIVSPDARNVPAFLMHLHPQVRCEAMAATDYLEQFSTQPLTPKEKLLKAMLRGARVSMGKRSGFA